MKTPVYDNLKALDAIATDANEMQTITKADGSQSEIRIVKTENPTIINGNPYRYKGTRYNHNGEPVCTAWGTDYYDVFCQIVFS